MLHLPMVHLFFKILTQLALPLGLGG